MRIRQAKPQFLRHIELQKLEVAHVELRPMIVFLGLWMAADNAGRFEWTPEHLKLDILPFVPFEISETLELLEEHGFIQKYEVGGKFYGLVTTFSDHQRISGKEAKMPAKYPSPQQGSTCEVPVKQVGSQGLRVKDEGLRIKDKGLSVPCGPSSNSIPVPKSEPFDGEMWMRAIFNAHPRPEWGQDAQNALREAAEAEMKLHGWTETQACEYLMARAQLYAQCVKGWPRSELHKANGTYSFFSKKIYRQDEALWRRENANGNGKPNKATERFNSNVEAIARGFGLGDRTGDGAHGGELAELQHIPGNGGSLEGGVAQDRRPIRLLDAPGNSDAVHPRTGRLPPDAGKDS